MRILAVGDPHGDMKKIRKISKKDIDIVLITGDLGKADFARKFYFENVKRKEKGLPEKEYTKVKTKKVYQEINNSTLNVAKYFCEKIPTYSILGNVGINMLKDKEVKKDEKEHKIKLPYLGRSLKKLKNFKLVKNSVRNILGLRIGFLEYFVDVCWYKEFGIKDKKQIKKSKRESDKAKKVLRNFKDIDILVCHQPPFGYLDKVSSKWGAPKKWWGKHAGSKIILDYVKKYKLKYVFCGHIHEGEGKAKIGKSEIYNLGVAGHKVVELNSKS